MVPLCLGGQLYGVDETMCENGGSVQGAAANTVVAAAVIAVISKAGLRIFVLGVVGKLTGEAISR